MYKIKNESEHHYEIQPPEGPSFHVAKVGLTPKMHENLKKMCSGGMAHYDEGTTDAEPEDEEVPPSSEEQAPSLEAAPPSQGPSLQQPAPNLNEPVSPDVAAQYNKAFQEEKLGGYQKGKAEQQLAEDTGETLDEQADNAQDLMEKHLAEEAARMQTQDDLAKKIANSKVDPSAYFHDRNLGGKIATIFGLVLGGVGAGQVGAGGVNQAVGTLNNLIQQDVLKQRENRENLNSLWNKNLAQTQDERQADILTQSQQLSIANQRLASIASTNGSPQAQAAYTTLSAGIQQQQANLSQQLGLLQLRNHIDTGGPVDARLIPFARDPKSMIGLGNGTAVHTTNPAKAAEIIGQHAPAIQSLTDLSKLDPSILNFRDPQHQKAVALMSTAINQLKTASGGGRENKEYIQRLENMINNPVDPKEAAEFLHGERTLQTIKSLKQQRDAKLAPYIPSMRTRESFQEQSGPASGR
jgi:hypothetical protein